MKMKKKLSNSKYRINNKEGKTSIPYSKFSKFCSHWCIVGSFLLNFSSPIFSLVQKTVLSYLMSLRARKAFVGLLLFLAIASLAMVYRNSPDILDADNEKVISSSSSDSKDSNSDSSSSSSSSSDSNDGNTSSTTTISPNPILKKSTSSLSSKKKSSSSSSSLPKKTLFRPTPPLPSSSSLFNDTLVIYGDESNIPEEYRASNWEPIIITECHRSFPKAAPCILERNRQKTNNQTNLVEAQELIYPPFQLELPMFLNAQDRQSWIELATRQIDRFVIKDNWAVFYEVYGQNLIFSPGTFRGSPPADVWSDNSCMGRAVNHESFLSDTNDGDADGDEGEMEDILIIATSPDSWSFQHFLDRVTVTITQATLSFKSTTIASSGNASSFSVVSGRSPGFNYADDYYGRLGAKRHIHSYSRQKGIRAKRLIFSCRSPLVHPFTTKLTSQKLGLFNNHKRYVAESDRKVVYYLSRSLGLERNGGRKVLNEERVVDAIRRLLVKRGRQERLEIFRPDSFTSLSDLMGRISGTAAAIIGPHGAAHYNGRFALPNTLIVEFIPKDRFAVMFFEQARMLHQKYAAVMVDDAGSGHHDMSISKDQITGLVDLLDRELGTKAKQPPLQKTPYGWEIV